MSQAQSVVGGRYELVRKIAEGGMGTVHEAVHLLSKRTVALKLLAPEVARDEAKRQRFLREVSAPAQIGHDGIVEIFDAGYDDKLGVLFVAMELLQGETLRDRLVRLDARRSSEVRDTLLDIFDRMLEPIAAAHARGIVHRDLKPENVFLQRRRDGNEVVKILDFGIARELDTNIPSVTQTGVAMGTPHYMAPEQAMSARDASFPADVWSLGAMLYEMLGGSPPFPGDTAGSIIAAVVTEAHRPIGALAPSTPPMLAHVVDRCLAKRPEDRPQNAAALLDELRRARGKAPASLGSSSTPAPGSTAPPATQQTAHTSPMGGYAATAEAMPSPVSSFAPPRAASAGPLAAPSPPLSSSGAPSVASPAPLSAQASGSSSTTWVWVVAGVMLALFGGGLCCVAGVVGLGLMGGESSSTRASLADGPIVWEGSLDGSDRVDERGNLYDTYSFDVGAGERVTIELSSQVFDTLLRVRTPLGATMEHDDIAYPANTGSRIDLPSTEPGEYIVHVTSFASGVTGAYRVSVHR